MMADETSNKIASMVNKGIISTGELVLDSKKFAKYFCGCILTMKLTDPEEERAFHNFSTARVSLRTVGLTSALLGCIGVSYFIMALLNAKCWYVIAASLFLTVSLRSPIFLFLWLVKSKVEAGITSNFVTRSISWMPTLENIIGISSSFSVGICLIARVLNGECSRLDQTHMWSCNSELASRALPQEHLLLLMLIPILYSAVFKAIKWEFICITWVLVVACISVSIAIAGATQSIPCLLVYAPTSMLILYENQRQNLILFFVAQRKERLLEENKALSEETQNELRHMIANVAHDLKTPLSAFMNGVEIISSQVEEMEAAHSPKEQAVGSSSFVHRPTIATAATAMATAAAAVEGQSGKSNGTEIALFRGAIAAIRDSIRNLHNTNAFMTMTINRCIDYTKASKGMQLEARPETVNLSEVIALPLNCMKDLQTRIAIALAPIPSSVAAHIITDKQWLQENLFCLISNAVKYSSNGSVTISVSLVSEQDPFIIAERKKLALNKVQVQPPATDEDDAMRRLSLNSRTPNRYSYMDRLRITGNAIESRSRASSEDVINQLEAGHCSGSVASSVCPQPSCKPEDRRVSAASYTMFGGSAKIYSVVEDDLLPPRPEDYAFKLPSEALPATAAAAQDLLLLEVEDTGIGLSEEVMRGLFAPFKQAQRRAGGTGLGLYSLAKRVQALDGCYGVRHRRDGQQGSVFWFAIPYKADTNSSLLDRGSFCGPLRTCSLDATTVDESRAFQQPSPTIRSTPLGMALHNVGQMTPTSGRKRLPPTASNSFRGLSVLIVDDSFTILKMTAQMLRTQGHTVTTAENGEEALRRLADRKAELAVEGDPQSCAFDVVLMDLNMPVMDGLEATTRLRAIETKEAAATGAATSCGRQIESRHQFVVGFSANSDHATMLEAYDAGVDDFICKPFALQTFYDTYNKHVSDSRKAVLI